MNAMQEPSPATKKAAIAYKMAFRNLFGFKSICNQSSRKELFLENGVLSKFSRSWLGQAGQLTENATFAGGFDTGAGNSGCRSRNSRELVLCLLFAPPVQLFGVPRLGASLVDYREFYLICVLAIPNRAA